MKVLLLLLMLVGSYRAFTQPIINNEGRGMLRQQTGATKEVDALLAAGLQHYPDSTEWYVRKALALAQKINYIKGKADSYLILQDVVVQKGKFSQALQYNLQALALYQALNDADGVVAADGMLQGLYREIGDYSKALFYAQHGLKVAQAHQAKGVILFPGHRWAPLLLAEIGQTNVLMHRLDTALYYTQLSIAQKERFNGTEWGFPIYLLGTIYSMKGQYRPALDMYRKAYTLSIQNNNAHDTLQVFSGMATLFNKMNETDSAIHYAQIVVKGWTYPSEHKNLLEAINNLAIAYKLKGNKDSALKYTEMQFAIKDSVFSAEKDRELQRVAFNERLKEEELKAAQIRYTSTVQLYVLIAGLLFLFIVIAVLWYSFRQQQKAKAHIEEAYSTLKATQAQLVQREKMASLGELTAGIAHEIQNPLNFVNNFSEVNRELIDELENELNNNNNEEAVQIVKDIKENEEKITHHGKRADAIVKGMLQHSNASTGTKVLTDINALCEEYVRLSYHGMRAKDKNFNAEIKIEFDQSIPEINVVPQDIGRVLLNLFNNAFYAVNEKLKAESLTPNTAYKPAVSIQTKKVDDKVEIKVEDNGNGISQNIINKIFQPFFTTKPTGQGTGLGLSLSYDIIKAHGGEINVESKEGEGSCFSLLL